MRHQVEQQLLQCWPRLYGYALSLTRDRDRACDLLQQAAVQALATQRPPSHQGAVRAWLFRIVRNCWIDSYRHDEVRANHVAGSLEDSLAWAYDDRVISDLSVRQGLALIEPALREIIELVDIHGFRYAEAAEILRVPPGTVMSRLSRARLALLEVLEGSTVRTLARARRRTS